MPATLLKEFTFDGPKGSRPQGWTYRTGLWDHGETEVEFTSRPENASLDGDGNLVITVRHEPGFRKPFTGARLDTQDSFRLLRGYVEFDCLIELADGAWPALWTLGDGEGRQWPFGGEIDALEVVNKDNRLHQTVHGPPNNWSAGWSGAGSILVPDMQTAFHRYGVAYNEDEIQFYLDRKPTLRVPRSGRTLEQWPWGTHAQYFIINYTIGKIEGAKPSIPSEWPRRLITRYVGAWDGVPGAVVSPPPPPPPPVVIPPETPAEIDVAGLRKDLLQIKGNSSSTAGDPWKRLKANVVAADRALGRLPLE